MILVLTWYSPGPGLIASLISNNVFLLDVDWKGAHPCEGDNWFYYLKYCPGPVGLTNLEI